MGKIVGLTFAPVNEVVEPEMAPASAYSCPVCGKEYKTEDGLEKHMKDKHPDYEGGENDAPDTVD